MRKSGWKNVPNCTKGKNHRWKESHLVFGESLICTRCGYDVCEQRYRELPSIPPTNELVGILEVIL